MRRARRKLNKVRRQERKAASDTHAFFVQLWRDSGFIGNFIAFKRWEMHKTNTFLKHWYQDTEITKLWVTDRPFISRMSGFLN